MIGRGRSCKWGGTRGGKLDGDGAHGEAGRRGENAGFSLVVILIGLVVIMLLTWTTLNRFVFNAGNDPETGQAVSPGLAMDRTRRQRTLADMQVIATANRTMLVDTGATAGELQDLESAGYMVKVPVVDAWGNPWVYQGGSRSSTLKSLGADGRPGPAPPQPWTEGAYECDLIMQDGTLVQGPGR